MNPELSHRVFSLGLHNVDGVVPARKTVIGSAQRSGGHFELSTSGEDTTMAKSQDATVDPADATESAPAKAG